MCNYYKIAGLTVKMDTYGTAEERARKYICGDCETPDIVVVSKWEKNKKLLPQISDDLGEYLSTGSDFYRQLLDFNGMMLHASAVAVDGRAYLFSADSGTGKSTHTALWLQLFGDRAFILNDDKPALRLENGVWYAYGTPWSGKHDISADIRLPVAGIAMLERAEKNSIEPFGGFEVIQRLFKQLNRPMDVDCREKLLELLDRLLSDVPVWRLRCNTSPDAARVAYKSMSGKEDV
ncbi:MAG: hypothetical protein IJY56_01345 [Clostridia bacterium]|nr:hypothetical protein [Clostridia bacterium]